MLVCRWSSAVARTNRAGKGITSPGERHSSTPPTIGPERAGYRRTAAPAAPRRWCRRSRNWQGGPAGCRKRRCGRWFVRIAMVEARGVEGVTNPNEPCSTRTNGGRRAGAVSVHARLVGFGAGRTWWRWSASSKRSVPTKSRDEQPGAEGQLGDYSSRSFAASRLGKPLARSLKGPPSACGRG